MNPNRERFLNLRTPPARLTAEETSWCLGFAEHDIPVLVSKGLLKPLGNPSGSCTKFFAFATVQELRSDCKWLSRATAALIEHWRGKNSRKSKPSNSITATDVSDIPAAA